MAWCSCSTQTDGRAPSGACASYTASPGGRQRVPYGSLHDHGVYYRGVHSGVGEGDERLTRSDPNEREFLGYPGWDMGRDDRGPEVADRRSRYQGWARILTGPNTLQAEVKRDTRSPREAGARPRDLS